LIGVAALCLFGFGVRTLSYEAVLGVLLGDLSRLILVLLSAGI
jgi:hypothetical protein